MLFSVEIDIKTSFFLFVDKVELSWFKHYFIQRNTNIHNKQLHRDKKTSFREAYESSPDNDTCTNTIECRHNNNLGV